MTEATVSSVVEDGSVGSGTSLRVGVKAKDKGPSRPSGCSFCPCLLWRADGDSLVDDGGYRVRMRMRMMTSCPRDG
jgi:hypothetical protein